MEGIAEQQKAFTAPAVLIPLTSWALSAPAVVKGLPKPAAQPPHVHSAK